MNKQQPLQRLGPWLVYEEIQLITLVNEHGSNWPLIASKVGTRTARDCRKKYAELSDTSNMRRVRPQNAIPSSPPVPSVPLVIPPNPGSSINRDQRMDLTYILN